MGKRGFRRGWRELSFSLAFNTAPLFGSSTPVLYVYFVENGLRNSDNLTKRIELEINKKGEKKEKKNERCGETDKLCGERISSYSKEGPNLLGS